MIYMATLMEQALTYAAKWFEASSHGCPTKLREQAWGTQAWDAFAPDD